MLKEPQIQQITLPEYSCISGLILKDFVLSYRVYGSFTKSSKNVLVCHALTGSSKLSGENGWWNGFIGEDKCIDPTRYPSICFDIPGNGAVDFEYDRKKLVLKDVARLIILALEKLAIHNFYAGIGPSLGGGLLWELAVEKPTMFEYIFPLGSHYKSFDWLIGSNHIQEKIINTSTQGIEIARMVAMMFYRSSKDFEQKFNGSLNENGTKNVVSYLDYQGEKLKNRFSKEAYLSMNHFLSSINVADTYTNLEEALLRISCKIRMVGINSDVLFPTHFSKEAYQLLKKLDKDVEYLELESDHGHDSFLIEFEKLEDLIGDYFIPNNL